MTSLKTTASQPEGDQKSAAPSISLPKGGGAIRGIGEKFAANPVTGTGSMSVPIATSPGRSGFGPQLSLTYDSGAGNGPFGFGWSLSLPSITRKTDKGLPQYRDAEESDIFILSSSEDLVPVFRQDPDGTWVAAHPGYQRDAEGHWVRDPSGRLVVHEDELDGYRIRRYRPRIEGLFARIERWSKINSLSDVHWRSISKDNILTIYGFDANSRIADPLDPSRIFTWLICETRDDKGNAVLYRYKEEDGLGIDLGSLHERNRGPRNDIRRMANRYLKRIHYGNRTPLLDNSGQRPRFLDKALIDSQITNADWMFEVVFDYEDHDATQPKPNDDQGKDPTDGLRYPWKPRPDAFSTYRSGFEIRTIRLCQRALMFHHFPGEAGVGVDCLVRSTDFTYSYEEKPTDVRNPVYSFLHKVTQTGYRRKNGDYDMRSLPPIEFEYTKPIVQEVIEEVDAESLENLPVGLDGNLYRWTDLHGEGVPGFLTEQAEAWYYKRNLSPIPVKMSDGREQVKAKFAPLETVALRPNVSLSGGAEFMDLASDGLPDVVVLDGPTPGLYEHDEAEGWQAFRPFQASLNHNMRDPNLKFIDLDGDGHADVLITENDAFVWHVSLAEEGFSPARQVAKVLDEEKGPRIVFADGTQSIYLADLSGDGLTDLVRIRNGEVCYWPNLGYCRFGAKVTMDNAPWFDHPDQFDHKRIRLADIDGSGTTDIIYLHREGVHLYFNQSGNSWSLPQQLQLFPRIDDMVNIVPLDLLGNGTACLIWSSPLPGDARQPMRYVNLMGSRKPHLLIKTINNLGAETRVDYAPSTKFYLLDKLNGKPWITRLPFPVHVVERVETYDYISRSRFVTRYAYHHGYFDGDEREFRGFGMVEQWDTEHFAALAAGKLPGDNLAAESHVPPVHTKTWFHTGIYLGRDHVSNYFAGLLDATDLGEYYREPGLSDIETKDLLLPDTVLPPDLTLTEAREACRSLKGSMLRQEVYADDAGSDATDEQIQRASVPYTVTEQNFTIRTVQPRGGNRHAVFFTHAREAISYHYERNPADPRIQHTLTLEVDAFGNVLKQAAIGYGRRTTIRVVNAQGEVEQEANPGLAELHTDDRAKQTTALLTYTENRVTNAVESLGTYRTPLPCEALTFELTGYTPTGAAGRYQATDLVEPDPGATGRLRHKFTDQVPYEIKATGKPCRRPIEWLRTLYRRDDLGGLLPLGTLQPLALPGESYKLAFTPGLLTQIFQRPRVDQPAESLLPDPDAVLGGQDGNWGGYLPSQTMKADGRFPATDADGHWWIPSGQSFCTINPADPTNTELAQARQHFFLPRRYRDPFGHDAFVDFDTHDLLMTETRDALGNRVTVNVNDYRVLQPRLVSDPNRNQTEVAFDTLGMVVGTAVMGKPLPALVEGDTLTGFVAELTQTELDAFFDAADPYAEAPGLLRDATTRILYDLDRFLRTRKAHPEDPPQWKPACAATLARETHSSAPLPSHGLRIQLSFSYSDGFGREIQKKIQAEPGPFDVHDPMSPTANPRWVGSGWTIYNNKGKPVRQYEPFFSKRQRPDGTLFSDHRFEFGVTVGVSPILFYDPAERVIATLHPNQTYEKVVFDPWQQTTYDVNDTCAPRNQQTGDPRTDPDIQGYVAEYFKTQPAIWQTWHAQRIGGTMGPNELNAAHRAETHADTPTTAHFDVLGRSFLTVARNRVVCAGHALDGTEENFATRVELDIEGNQRTVRDERKLPVNYLPTGPIEQRIVMHYAYDMLGNRIHQLSMEAGARWLLNDVAGKPIRAWDSRGHNFVTLYDALRRPMAQYVRGTFSNSDPLKPNSDPRTLNSDILVDKIEYGEPSLNASPAEEGRVQRLNLRTRIYRHFDSVGEVINAGTDPNTVTLEAYDFKGNLLRSTRRLAKLYQEIPDWSQDPEQQLDTETFASSTRYDALNRPIQSTAPHSSLARAKRNIIQPVFNEANLLERVHVWLERASEPGALLDPDNDSPSPVGVLNIDYNEKGQRLRIDYKNGASTGYSYDEKTFRLTQLRTVRGNKGAADCAPIFVPRTCEDPPTICQRLASDACIVQDLTYTYDPAGNIAHIQDDAQQIIFFRNKCVEPSNDYIYDALYRLIQASGREHLGQLASGEHKPPTAPDAFNAFHPRLDHPCDGKAMGTYIERYIYDAVGNFLQMQHRGTDPTHAGWTRAYDYLESSLIEDGSGGTQLKNSNRLSRTMLNPGGNSPQPETYQHDAHGNMVRMPHLGDGGAGPNMHWDYKDQLRQTDQGGGGTAYYVYDAAGQRLRKVWEKAPGLIEERIYLGGFEIFRKHGGPIGANSCTLERETLHVMDDKLRLALVETRPLGNDPAPRQLIRYQFGNHLGSVSLELDHQALIISYEEYSPYGSTSYQAVRSQTETPKRYRYTGKEGDEESGLSYYGARYYAPWLGKWIACDPNGLGDGPNVYIYVKGNPIRAKDLQGNNTFEDLALFIRNQAGFEQGARTPPNYQSGSASPFGTAAHKTATGVVQEMQKVGYINANRIVAEPVIVNDVIVAAGSGPAGAPKGALAPDLLFTNQNVQGSVVGQQASVVAQELGDLKYGGGQAAAKYSQVGVTVRTVNGATSSTATDPSLLQMAAAEKPLSVSSATEVTPATAAAEAASPTAAEAIAAEGAAEASLAARAPGVGSKIMKGLGVAGAVAGSLVGGYQVGTGARQICEGNTGEGVITASEGAANLGLTMGVTAAVKANIVTAPTGIAGGAATAGAGLLAAGGIMLATEEARRSFRGEKTAAVEATEFYADLVVEGGKQGGVTGLLKQTAGWTGGFFSTLIAVGQGY